MPVISQWERKKILITVKTYPTPARNGVEVSCTAGITEDGEWIRLFPIPFRLMELDRQFKKYQWIEVDVAKSSDPRPESYRINIESLEILPDTLPTSSAWQARKDVVYQLKARSLCHLQRGQDIAGHSTLGLFRPREIKRFIIEADRPEWTETELAKLQQLSMFEGAPPELLEKIPYKFRYEMSCDESECQGHRLSCTDWELSQAYRKWRRQYASIWRDKLTERFERDMIHRKDTHFFVGTMRGYPRSWIVVGLFYPPKVDAPQLSLPI